MTPKLTDAQKNMLARDEGRCVAYYRPYESLLALGFVADIRNSFGHVHWRITDAGRAARRALGIPDPA